MNNNTSERFILDPYIIRAVTGTTASDIFEAWLMLYPYYRSTDLAGALEEIAKWLNKLQKKPGLALSTGRRNSFRGEWTCALLAVLQAERPKAVRVRMDIAWDILYSPVGKSRIGNAPELDAKRSKRSI